MELTTCFLTANLAMFCEDVHELLERKYKGMNPYFGLVLLLDHGLLERLQRKFDLDKRHGGDDVFWARV